jgi:signal transduction histidine kinase/CheY-like chemotaxis protein
MMGIWVSVTLSTLAAVGVGQYRASSGAARRAETRVRDNQHEMGMLLVANQAIALRVMAVDNAFSDVRELVRQTVREDDDVIYGYYVDAVSAPWIVVTPKTREIGAAGSEANPWLEEIPREPPRAPAPGPHARALFAFGANVEEYAQDVFDGTDYLGTVRYGISMVRTELDVRQELERARRSLLKLLSLLVALGAAGVVLGVFATRRMAHRITQPLSELATASAELAQGNRSRRVAIASGDEIEQLAQTFNAMAEANEVSMKELEVRTTEALESSRIKSEFLANMSHEIRTPMNGILGIARLMNKMPLEGKLRRYVETIDSSASALLTIVNDVLDFSKMEAGKYSLSRDEFDLRKLVQETCDLLATRAREKGLEFVYRIDPKIGSRYRGDSDRLRQVINNLLGNAIKFTDRGEVFLDARWLGRSGSTATETLRIAVRDTGIGIAREDMGKLFNAFSQVDGSMVRKFGGTGLGLAISKRLVEMMGGSVGVESVVGEGSEFFCELHLEALGDHASDREAWADGKRVIVVESNGRWQSVIREHLESWGMSVLTFDRSEDALAYAGTKTAGSIDMAIIGTQPGELGVDEFARRVRSLENGANASIVVLYQPGTGAVVSDADEDPIARIPKPVRRSELYDAVQQAFHGDANKTHDERTSSGEWPVDGAGRILVVDDNEINRFVAAEMLEQMGYGVVVAKNGSEAVELVDQGEFSVVLMDCQMPVMDGYAATREIRRKEEGRARHQPIVALTAHALPDEREKVLAAGMDDYISKPVRPSSLDRMIRRYAPGSVEIPQKASVTETPEQEVCLDRTVSRSKRLIELFLANVPAQLDAIESSVGQGQISEIRRSAHKTKGSCLALGAVSMARLAEKLQNLAETGNVDGAPALVVRLREQYRKVAVELVREKSGV